MASKSDWEREYEEDMRRMQSGESIKPIVRREEGPPKNEQPHEEDVSSNSATTTRIDNPPDVASQSPTSSAKGSNLTGETDERMGLPYVSLPYSFSKKWMSKFGKRIFFAESVSLVELKWFGREVLHPRTCIIGPNTIYLVSSVGSITHALVTVRLTEVYEINTVRVFLRAIASDFDLLMDFRSAPSRHFFFEALTNTAKYNKKQVKISKQVAGQKLNPSIKMQNVVWQLVEDPRTGLPIIYIPKAYQEKFGFLNDKLVHFISDCHYIYEDWKSSLTHTRCVMWLSPTCLYFCETGGPKDKNKGYLFCVPVEHLIHVVAGPYGYLGIRVKVGDMNSTEYHDVMCQIASDANSSSVQSVVFALQQIHGFRVSASTLTVFDLTEASVQDDCKSVRDLFRGRIVLRVLKGTNFTVYPLRTRDELFKLLTDPILT